MYTFGIDAGSTTTKAVILGENKRTLGSSLRKTGGDCLASVNAVVSEALSEASLSLEQISYIAATGYGRINIPLAKKTNTEILCQAKSISWQFPSARTVIDVGGQDVKGIKIEDGKLLDFVMNDKCAAGSGRYLEYAARALEVELEDVGLLSLQSTNPVVISSTCTVFAESEIITHVALGVPKADIIAGLHKGFADRICTMLRRIGITKDVVLTGGVAKNIGFVKALQDRLGIEVLIPQEPSLTCAIGAAVIAWEELNGGK